MKKPFLQKSNFRHLLKKTFKPLLKTSVGILTFLAITTSSQAQVGEFYYGAPDRDEVANDVKRTSTGNSVIVGYSTTSSSIVDRDFFITLINSTGGVVWTRRGGTQTGDVLESVIELANGNFVAVGYSDENTTGNQAGSNKRAFIICYDASGTLQWLHKYRVSIAGGAGDRFNTVCQLNNGNIVAAGCYDDRGNFSDGLVGYFDVNGNLIGSSLTRIEMRAAIGGSSYSDGFYGIVANGDEVYLTGVCGDGSQYDGVVVQLNAAGSIVFSNRYTYTSPVNNNAYNWFSDVFIRDNQLIMDAGNLNNYSGITSILHGIVRMDLNGNSPQVVDIENYNYSTNKFCNATDFYPITATDYFSLENPASTLYSTHAGMPGSDATISRVDATIPTLSLSRSIPRDGEQTLNAIDATSSIITMAGSGNNDPANIGGYDVYVLTSDYNLITTNECALEPIDILAAAPTVTIPALYENVLYVEVNDDQTIEVDETPFEEILLCGELPPVGGGCEDKCYWKLDGNSSVSSTNFLGSINSEDLRLATTNQTRVTIEKDYGNVGIGVHPNQEARLLIDHDGTATTFPVFFKLQYQGGNDYYKISRGGSGSSFAPLVWAHKASTNNEPAIKTIGSTDFANDNTSAEAIQEFKSFIYDGGITTAPAGQRLLYNFGDLSTNYMKMSYNGYMGIGLITNATYPTARLHVDCINIDPDINNPSNIRFENLQVQDAPYILVMDDDGYVYRTDNPNYVPSDGAGLVQPTNSSTNTTTDVKKLQKEVEDLKNLVYELSKQNAQQNKTATDNNTGSNASLTPYLIDNVPNPYSQSTLIRYYLPAGTTNAAITITNNEGIVMETISLTGEGLGTLTFNASNLADGTYAYTLVVAGQKIDTKKMLITR